MLNDMPYPSTFSWERWGGNVMGKDGKICSRGEKEGGGGGWALMMSGG